MGRRDPDITDHRITHIQTNRCISKRWTSIQTRSRLRQCTMLTEVLAQRRNQTIPSATAHNPLFLYAGAIEEITTLAVVRIWSSNPHPTQNWLANGRTEIASWLKRSESERLNKLSNSSNKQLKPSSSNTNSNISSSKRQLLQRRQPSSNSMGSHQLDLVVWAFLSVIRHTPHRNSSR